MTRGDATSGAGNVLAPASTTFHKSWGCGCAAVEETVTGGHRRNTLQFYLIISGGRQTKIPNVGKQT